MVIITVRLASVKDAELIADLSRQTFYDTYVGQNVKEDFDDFMNNTFTREALIKEVATPGNTFLLAYDEDDAVGYVRLRENKDPIELRRIPSIEVARIYVTKEYIGKGVGKVLLEKSIEIAKERNKRVIWLAVWPKNQRAIDFYIKWGFERFAEQDFVFGKEVQKDWLMKKSI